MTVPTPPPLPDVPGPDGPAPVGPPAAGPPRGTVGAVPSATPAAPERTRALGPTALILSLIVAVVIPSLAAIALLVGGGIYAQEGDATIPVVALAALGTLLGTTAAALAIVAIASRRGRRPGIAALVLAVLGPLLFIGLPVLIVWLVRLVTPS